MIYSFTIGHRNPFISSIFSRKIYSTLLHTLEGLSMLLLHSLLNQIHWPHWKCIVYGIICPILIMSKSLKAQVRCYFIVWRVLYVKCITTIFLVNCLGGEILWRGFFGQYSSFCFLQHFGVLWCWIFVVVIDFMFINAC